MAHALSEAKYFLICINQGNHFSNTFFIKIKNKFYVLHKYVNTLNGETEMEIKEKIKKKKKEEKRRKKKLY